MGYYPYDSRNPLYRSKFGAVVEGENLALRLLLHRDACVHSAFLRVKNDNDSEFFEIIMKPGDWVEDYRFYSCNLNFNEGLYWYCFRYTSDYGEFFVTKAEHSLGIVREDGGLWQQTVYERDYATPGWLDGGIIYQIFPDRFFYSGKKKKNVPADRYICTDWSKQPEYRQNNGICSLGNDYYGGDLKGIEQKLPYLKSLGVSCIYLNPIFEAHSNHRYDTADYFKIDPLLGDERDLVSLVKAASEYGIYIILDGVFSHTGADSRYFNKYRRYEEDGAYNTPDSPYHSWYVFYQYPDEYSSWWGVHSLPETNENDPGFSHFITGEDGVLRYWLKKGVRGWRLDVADELPDEFLDNIRRAVKDEGEDNLLLGEVWEDATNKISYGKRRRFLRGKQLDSVMNYPFAAAITNYVTGGNARDLVDTVLEILENYPPQSVKLLMNHIGTHDTMRILTKLANPDVTVGDREWQSRQTLTREQYIKAKRLLKIASVLQYTLPGVPSLYYGNEAGLTGYGDPFCRGSYPWGHEDTELLDFYRALGKMRLENKAFRSGEFIPVYANFGEIIYIRRREDNEVLVAANRWHEPCNLTIPERFAGAFAIFGNPPDGTTLTLKPESFAVLVIQSDEEYSLS